LEDLTEVLYEEIDERVIEKMPEWFKVLRKNCIKKPNS